MKAGAMDRGLSFDQIGLVRGEQIANKREEEIREGLSLSYEILTFRTWWVDGLSVGLSVLYARDGVARQYEVRELEEIGRRRGLKITIRRVV